MSTSYHCAGGNSDRKMYRNEEARRHHRGPNYIAYFYGSEKINTYLNTQKSFLADLNRGPPATYDFSSDLIRGTGFRQTPTVEQIIANGYLAIPKSDPVEAILSDKKHTSWLGLDDVIGQIRRRYELYEKNMYELELGKCSAINTLYTHEAWHGPSDSRGEYSLGKRMDKLYKDQREERTNLWRDISRLRLLLPENAQKYLAAYRKESILRDSESDEL